MADMVLFKDCKFLLALPEHGGISTGLSILVEGDTIRDIAPAPVLEQKYPGCMQMAEVIACENKIVMPGLLDAHNHLCNTHMNLARMVAINYNDIAAHMMTTIHDPYGWMTDECLYSIKGQYLLPRFDAFVESWKREWAV